MNCPNGIRQCPHNWTNCDLCANLEACKTGTYIPESEAPEPETDLEIVIKAAEISAKVIHAEAVKSAESIRGTWAEKLNGMSEEERWAEYGRYPVPHFNEKPVLPAGPSSPGGGSKSKNHKKPKRKTPEYMKMLGM